MQRSPAEPRKTRAQERVGGLIQVGVRHDNHVVLGAAEGLHALSVRGGGWSVTVAVRDGRDRRSRPP